MKSVKIVVKFFYSLTRRWRFGTFAVQPSPLIEDRRRSITNPVRTVARKKRRSQIQGHSNLGNFPGDKTDKKYKNVCFPNNGTDSTKKVFILHLRYFWIWPLWLSAWKFSANQSVEIQRKGSSIWSICQSAKNRKLTRLILQLATVTNSATRWLYIFQYLAT